MGQWSSGYTYVFVTKDGFERRFEVSRPLAPAEVAYVRDAVWHGRWAEVRLYGRLVEATA